MKKDVEVKRTFVEMLRILDKETSYYSKFIDAFLELPGPYQDSFIQFLLKDLERDDWTAWAKDDTLFIKVIRAILAHYSGRDEINQPCKKDLAKRVGEFLRSPEFDQLSKVTKANVDEENVVDLLGEM